MKIQKELDETKIVLHKTIESVLERGEKIDSLVEKSDGLSAQSKMFYSEFLFSFSVLGLGNGMLIWDANRTGEAAELLLCNYVIVLRAIWRMHLFGQSLSRVLIPQPHSLFYKLRRINIRQVHNSPPDDPSLSSSPLPSCAIIGVLVITINRVAIRLKYGSCISR